jgi:hypothetical protein
MFPEYKTETLNIMAITSRRLKIFFIRATLKLKNRIKKIILNTKSKNKKNILKKRILLELELT